MARQKKTTQSHPVTATLAEKVVLPIIAWCDEESGRRAKILAAFRDIIQPEVITRQVFEAWIATNPEQRTEPMLGNGLALQMAAARVGIKAPKP